MLNFDSPLGGFLVIAGAIAGLGLLGCALGGLFDRREPIEIVVPAVQEAEDSLYVMQLPARTIPPATPEQLRQDKLTGDQLYDRIMATYLNRNQATTLTEDQRQFLQQKVIELYRSKSTRPGK
jgi:hypothetical protein